MNDTTQMVAMIVRSTTHPLATGVPRWYSPAVPDLASLAADVEKDFLDRHPDYENVLSGAADATRERLRTAIRHETPFPHVWVEGLLPERVYQLVLDAWPPDNYFWSNNPNRMDLVTQPAGIRPSDARAELWDGLPASLRRVWDVFVLDINRGVVGPFVQEMFRPEIDARLSLLERTFAEQGARVDYMRPPFHPKMNVGRLMMRSSGHTLHPHVDALAYLVTALYYFPQSDTDVDTLGTTLYRVNEELDTADLLRREKTEYFHKAGIAAEPAVQIPFVGNSLLAFANTNRSAHGVHVPTTGWRRSFQSHLSIKRDTDHL